MKTVELIIGYTSLLHIRNYSSKTVRCYVHHLNLFLNYFKVSAVLNLNSGDLVNYFYYLLNTKKLSCSSIKQAFASIHFFYKELFRIELDFSLFDIVKNLNIMPNFLTCNEIKKIINSIVNLKHKVIIATIYSCGLRISEAINLKISDIDISTLTIKIISLDCKKVRYVMLSKKLLQLFYEYIKIYKPQNYLFEGRGGAKYSARSIEEIFNYAIKKANITKEVAVHSLRHSFAFHLLEGGTDIHLVQQLLGHKHLSTTHIYTQINPVSITKIKSPFDAL